MMERKLVGLVLAIFGLMLWAGPAAATPAGTVVEVSGSATDHGRVLNRGETVQIGDTLDVPAGGNSYHQIERHENVPVVFKNGDPCV